MRIEIQSPFEMNEINKPSGGASTVIGTIGRFTRRSGATALTAAFALAVVLTLAPRSAVAVECLLDTTDNGTADDPGDTDGGATSDVSFATACGSGADANGNGATVFGFDARTAVGTTDGIAVGDSAFSDGTGAIAIGGDVNDNTIGARATGDHAIAIGSQALTDGDGAIAIGGDLDGDGTGAMATSGTGAIAIGADAEATAFRATAVGLNSEASAGFATAYGASSTASGSDSAAFGDASTASGLQATALGNNAVASGDVSTAVGNGAVAAFSGSTALGAGAVTTAVNQMAFGTATNTYTMSGLTSAASLAAQAGPLELVTTDAAGNLATDGGAAFAAFADNSSDIRQNREGVALALALDAPYVPPSQRFAISGGFGFFEGSNAFALSTAARLNDNFQIDAGIGIGLDKSSVGGRVGGTYTW